MSRPDEPEGDRTDAPRGPEDQDTLRVPLVEEVPVVETRTVETGRVVIATRIMERDEVIEHPLRSDEIEIERVPVGRPVDAIPEPRQEGDLLIVPVVAEELVVTKRLVLVEEVRIRKRQSRRTEMRAVRLRSQEAIITREPPDDRRDSSSGTEEQPATRRNEP